MRPRLVTPASIPQCRSKTSELLCAAQFMSEDSDRRVFNRFDELRVVVLLRLQHRLAELAREIEPLRRAQDVRFTKGQFDKEKDKYLEGRLDEVEVVLAKYDKAFWAQSRFEELRSPPANLISEFLSYFGLVYPLVPVDLGATGLKTFRADALASTTTREKSAVHCLVDQHDFLKRFFITKSKHKQRPGSMFIYSESTIRRVEQTFVHVGFCILLLCPVIALSVIQNTIPKLVAVVGFLLAAAFLTSGMVNGANNAGLAVLAGYGAILIFFLGVKVDL